MVTKSGSLDILKLPSLTSVFSSKHLTNIPSTLSATTDTDEAMTNEDVGDGVMEARLVDLGGSVKRVHLIVSNFEYESS